MIFGLSGQPLQAGNLTRGVSYVANAINGVCMRPEKPFSPALLFAVYWREMGAEHWQDADGGASRLQDGADPVTGLMPDGSNAGRGAFQLTDSWPDKWERPDVAAVYAVDVFLAPAIAYWHGLMKQSGDALIKLAAATYNEGLGEAVKYHATGDVDAGTTNAYGHGVLAIYQHLVATGRPPA